MIRMIFMMAMMVASLVEMKISEIESAIGNLDEAYTSGHVGRSRYKSQLDELKKSLQYMKKWLNEFRLLMQHNMGNVDFVDGEPH